MMQLYLTLPAATYSSAPSIDKISTSTRVNVRFKQGKTLRRTSVFKNDSFCLSTSRPQRLNGCTNGIAHLSLISPSSVSNARTLASRTSPRRGAEGPKPARPRPDTRGNEARDDIDAHRAGAPSGRGRAGRPWSFRAS